MGKGTNIQWCDDTVNPTTGCGGCELWQVFGELQRRSCYAGILHEGRLAKAMPSLYGSTFNEIRFAPGRMAKAVAAADLRGTKRSDKPWLDGMPRIIFVGDMADIFTEVVAFEYLADEILASATSKHGNRHIQMWLTKRPGQAVAFARWLKDYRGLGWPSNVWQGTSVTNQTTAKRADILAEHPAPIKFLSVEPMVSPVNFTQETLKKFALVIVGGESGPDARPCHLSWIRQLARQCRFAGVPVFVKQLGARPQEDEPHDGPEWPVPLTHGNFGYVVPELRDSHGGDPEEWPEDLRIREFPNNNGEKS